MYAFQSSSCTAFAGTDRLASGEPREVAGSCKELIDAGDGRCLLIFDDASAELVEIDFRGSLEDVLTRLSSDNAEDKEIAESAKGADAATGPRSPGRPKLGVVGREVTLLPRHWEWLNMQPGGASVALRKLVEQARRVNRAKDRIRSAQEVAYRFMSGMAGDYPGFEEASRALFAGDRHRFDQHTRSWPRDVRDYATMLATDAFPVEEGTQEDSRT